MCAYNVRKNKRVDHEPASGPERQLNRLWELVAWCLGILVMAAVVWLAARFLF